ncbi:MAG: hypothetical protein J5669_08740 [Bacteroidales bacterium]|nr:hypothetical protein [Bacteroidales bacterium]
MEYKLEENLGLNRCLQCGNVIEYGGRPDRKFCSTGCKNRYNNYRRFHRRDLSEKNILGILDRNYQVLERLLKMSVKSLDRVTLAYMGFDPGYSTSYARIGRHNIYTCFDIRYELTASRIREISVLEVETTSK